MSLHEFLGEERLLEWFYSKNSSNTGTKIGYRRVSGKIGLTNKENGVRGACNAAAVYVCHQNGWGVAKSDDPIIRPSTGAKRPEFARMSKKTAIRFFLSSCRNSIYDRLVHGGMSIVNASILSQGVYGFFAQNRDLIYDLMKGEGWNVSTPNANNFTDDSESEIDTHVNNIAKVAEESIAVSSASASETSIVVSTPNTSDSSTEVSSE